MTVPDQTTPTEDSPHAGALLDRGVELYQEEKFAEAAKVLQEALTLHREDAGAGQDEGRELEVNILCTLGDAQEGLEDYISTLASYREALALCEGLDDRVLTGRAWLGRGWAAFLLGRFQEADEDHREALAIAEEIDDQEAEGLVLRCLGMTALAREDPAAAHDYGGRALVIAEAMDDGAGEVDAFCLIGFAATKEGRWPEAQDAVQRARTVSRALADPGVEAAALTALGVLRRAQGRSKMATAHFIQAQALTATGTNRVGDRMLSRFLTVATRPEPKPPRRGGRKMR